MKIIQTDSSAPTKASMSKKKTKDSGSSFGLDEAIQCFLRSYPCDIPDKSLKKPHTTQSPASPGQKGTKSPPCVETMRASGDLLVRVPSKTFTAPPNRNNDDSKQGSSGHTSSGESITYGKRRRSSFASAMGKILRPTSKSSNHSCLTRCTARRSSHRKVNDAPAEATAERNHKVAVKHQPNVYMKHYIDAYRELSKAMSKFGVTLSFVVSSLYTTIDVMDGYMKHDKDKHYEHVDRMIRYEMNNKLVQQKIKGKDSGTKNLLLLHRCMAFILEFITGLKDSNSKTKAVDVAQHAYDKTLSQYYSWIINKMASVAFNALPSTKECMDLIVSKDPKVASAQLKKLIDASRPVYNRVQDIYKEHHQLDCV